MTDTAHTYAVGINPELYLDKAYQVIELQAELDRARHELDTLKALVAHLTDQLRIAERQTFGEAITPRADLTAHDD